MEKLNKSLLGFFVFAIAISLGMPNAFSKSARELDASVQDAMERFRSEVPQAASILNKSKGILVLPSVIKAGFGIGAEYGEGALLVGGNTVDYYNTIGGSFGLQIGAQKKSIYIFFLEDYALDKFQHSDGWEVGVDGSVALVDAGAAGSVDTTIANQPIVAFVLGQKGLMFNLTLEGSKFNKIEK